MSRLPKVPKELTIAGISGVAQMTKAHESRAQKPISAEVKE